MQERLVHFLRKRDYAFVRDLGQGACGRTVLLRDLDLDQLVVCKKYSPLPGIARSTYFLNFVREIKLLHELHHTNVVRVFNHYLYPEEFSGYILMEHVEGTDVQSYLRSAPERANEIFEQTVQGFAHLEARNVLHRDIRPQNLLVRHDGIVKVIDLGFGKKIAQSDDFDKSISLNWWCELPQEFADATYSFATEVYFVGKLFELMVEAEGLEHFKYTELLKQMCVRDPEMRLQSFSDVESAIGQDLFYEIKFSAGEREAYRDFADAVESQLVEVERGKYINDIERLKTSLENAHRSVMLETVIPDAAVVLICLLTGAYRYRRRGFPVGALRNFVRVIKEASGEKQRILLANLHGRLDGVREYKRPMKSGFDDMDDDIPF